LQVTLTVASDKENSMLEQIFNFRQIDPLLATAGQPDEAELYDIGRAGYEVVINLGLSEAEYAVANERSIVESQGLSYLHLPVSFQQPAPADFTAFRRQLKALAGRKCFIHCAANKRVSVFLALYRAIEEGMPWNEARQTIDAVWQPDDNWRPFIRQVLTSEGIAFQEI
jgi:uncharacterized protein (TIGR01244 family)